MVVLARQKKCDNAYNDDDDDDDAAAAAVTFSAAVSATVANTRCRHDRDCKSLGDFGSARTML